MSPHEHYIHGHGAAVLANHRRRTAEDSAAHLLPRLRPGMRLLDVGCGPGTITAGLAARVAPGQVIGLDREPAVLPGAGEGHLECGYADAGAVAKPVLDAGREHTHPGSGRDAAGGWRHGTGSSGPSDAGGPAAGRLPESPESPESSESPATREVPDLPNLSFVVGDVYELPFADGEFDVVHAHQLLHHLADPVAAIREMARVTRPGGIVSLREADYGAMTFYPEIPRLAEFIDVFRAQGRENGTDLDAGRRLYGWALAAGLHDVEPGASAWCFATEEQRAFWSGTWAERVLSSAFAEQAIEAGLVEGDLDLERFAAAWREWGKAPDGWFAVVHGEVLATP